MMCKNNCTVVKSASRSMTVILLFILFLLFSRPVEAEDSNSDYIRVEDIKVGDMFYFGNYEQDEQNVMTPIEWAVLEKKNNDITVISTKVLDTKKFHMSENKINWAQSDIRKWLNNDIMSACLAQEVDYGIKCCILL